MAKQAPVAKYEVNGHTYTKEEASDGGFRYRKDGSFCSPQTFSGGVGNYTRGDVDGQVLAADGKWMPSIEVEMPTPDGIKSVRWDKASQAGQMANGRSIRDTIEIDGETYTTEEIQEAFDTAGTVDGQVVRY